MHANQTSVVGLPDMVKMLSIADATVGVYGNHTRYCGMCHCERHSFILKVKQEAQGP